MSVDYYVRLEQGRSPNVSDAVLDAIASALRLGSAEREHLGALARATNMTGTSDADDSQEVRPGLRALLEAMVDVPAFLLGRRTDVLAFNPLADAVFGFAALPPALKNSARFVFTSSTARELYPDWERVAAETAAYLALDAGRHPGDPVLTSLVGELAIASPDFRRLWARHDILIDSFGPKQVRHPIVGDLELDYETLSAHGDMDQLLVTFTVRAGSPTDERLRILASWAATER